MVRQSLTPMWAAFEQPVACHTHDQQTLLWYPASQTVEYVQGAVIRPVNVFQEHHHGNLLAYALEDTPPGTSKRGHGFAADHPIMPFT